MSERISYLVGWLEGFSGSIWAMCNVQEREVVVPEAVAEYEEKVKELREALKENKYPMCDTGPFTVKTMPCTNPESITIGSPYFPTVPIDLTPKITFKSGEDE